MFPMGHSHWKMKPIPPTEKQIPTNEKWSPFQEMVARKRTRKIGNCINLCFTHKITLEEDGRNSTRMWFSHLKHSKFLKMKEIMVYKGNPLLKCKGPPQKRFPPPFPKILNMSPLKSCCLDWQSFLNWLGSCKTLPMILKCFDSAVWNWW